MRGTSMKINMKLFIIVSALLCAAYHMQGMEKIKSNLENILNADNISWITSYSNDKYNTHNVHLYYGHTLIGTSSYYQYYNRFKKRYEISLDDIRSTRWKNKGIGKQLFDLTMHFIAQDYPDTPDVTGIMVAYDPPADLSFLDAKAALFRFYERVGATVNQKTDKFKINLKDAGYYDEN